MSYSLKFKKKAISLRKLGFSVKEIVKNLGISQGTASLWLRDVVLDKKAISRIENIKVAAQFKSIETRSKKRSNAQKKLDLQTNLLYSQLPLSQDLKKVLCAILFWTEGSKTNSCVSFINSDPMMIEVYIKLMRESFNLDEKKFRGLVHIHDYHDEKEIVSFWSRLSRIPLSQFNKSYRKSHTQKRKREGYKGCFRVRYYDSRIARELYSIYTTLPDYLSGKLGS